MKCFTIENGEVITNVLVESHLFPNAVSVPVIRVEETGHGRKLAFVPIQLIGGLALEEQEALDQF